MRKILVCLTLILASTTLSHADEMAMNIPQDLNDNLTTGSGYQAPVTVAQTVDYKYTQSAAACRNNESQTRNSGATEADSATAYYDCLKQTISQ